MIAHRKLRLLSATACLFLAAAIFADEVENQPVVRAGTIDLREYDLAEGRPVLLSGDWEFYWKRYLSATDERPEPDGFFRMPGIWSRFDSPNQKTRDEVHRGKGFATHRLIVLLPVEHPPLALRLYQQVSSFRLIVNGQEIARRGRPGKTRATTRPEVRPGLVVIPEELTRSGRLELLLEIANFHEHRGASTTPIQLGPERRLGETRETELVLEIFILSGMLVIGVYHLGLFLIRRRDRSLLYFGLFSIVLALRNSTDYELVLGMVFPELPWVAIFELGFITYYLSVSTVVLYLHHSFPLEFHRLVGPILAAIGLAFALCVPFYDTIYHNPVNLYFHGVTVVTIAYILFALNLGLARGRTGALTFLVGFLVLAVSAVHAILRNFGYLLEIPGFVDWAMLIFIVVQALSINRRFARAFGTVERLSAELGRANEELIQLERVKDEFMANLSHELRTPLTAVQAGCEMIAIAGDSPGAVERYRREIENGSSTLIGYLDDLMLVTDVETRPELHLSEFSLADVTEEILERHEDQLAERGIIFQSDSTPGLVIRADRRLLYRALENIFRNAVQYNRQDGRIRLEARRDGESDGLRISLSDTGIGIDPKQIRRIWEKFYRVDHYHGSGVGLGLFLARRIVELHNGEIQVTGEPRQGSIFTILLPAAVVRDAGQVAD